MDEFLDRIVAALPHLRRYAIALTHDRDRADDLVQDAVIRAIDKRRLWRRSARLKPWLFTIMVNVYRNRLRAEVRTSSKLTLDELEPQPAEAARQLDQTFLSQTARAMERLSPEQRQVLLLVAVEGFSYDECAMILDIPAGTVMSRLSRARAALRKSVNDVPTPRLRRVK